MSSPLYDLFAHGRMIRDRVRGDAYARAITATVRRNDVVLDLGTGSGVLSVIACRAGARKVYAIEEEDIIELAREIVRINGCADRVELIQASSYEVELPECANVLVADVRGVLPFFRTSLTAMIDARNRFLAPGGTIIPQRDVVRGALAESAEAYGPHVAPWEEGAWGVDLTPARRLAVNDMRKQLVRAEEVISNVVVVATIDYATFTSPGFEGVIELIATRNATAHGFTVWFDSTLAPGVEISNAPDRPEMIYGRSFIPFESPVTVHAGDEIVIDLAARLVNEEDYLWRWNTTLKPSGGEARPLFRQSTFFAYPRRFGGVRE